ncbi:cbb3-type cytochrome oxidase maturation protein [Amaricoccus macauensis]|uniref:Cbb3-type cytochrome oxidase maturation protein n=1 Tax=Amaricoccus macauensis TaxID=57001 RepID=A0A840SLW9_9RHOB|nr:cbb3-type cytochrome oxidase assembly protein CcoS [Amaricoccus macauensis]MBB5221605.1 cbb3-type cytochrome oxidase maturation protein [Amaricoccus macauensis]
MSALAILIPTSLGLGLFGLVCFVWSLRSNQYQDLEGAAERILLDDEPGAAPTEPRGASVGEMGDPRSPSADEG